MGEQQDIHERIENDFSFHPATGVTGPKHDRVRRLMRNVAHELALEVPAGREASVMLTKLEETMMWANAGIARERAYDLQHAYDLQQPMTPTPRTAVNVKE